MPRLPSSDLDQRGFLTDDVGAGTPVQDMTSTLNVGAA